MSGFARHLCVALLGHWEPELPMLFTGYIDESDTHGRRPNMTMGAMLSTAGRWDRCERAYGALRKEFDLNAFHGTEFHAARGEFEHWKPQDFPAFFAKMGKIVATHVIETFTVHCEYDVYDEHFRQKKPPKMPGVSQFGICFMGILDGMMRHVLSQGQGTNHKLSVVVEDGHPNAGGAAEIFKARKDRLERAGSGLLLSLTLASKRDVPLLQLPDSIAYGHTLEQRAIRRGHAPSFQNRPEPIPPEPQQSGWSILEVTPEYLGAVIEEYETGRVAAHEAYLRRRQAWLDAQASSGGRS